MHRPLALLLLALGGCSANSTTAASSPRIDGQWKITLTVTRLTGELLDRHQGDVLDREWGFTPKCAMGACDLVLKRQDPTGILITTPVSFEQGKYKAEEAGQPIVCSAPDKSAVFDQGLQVHVTIQFRAVASAAKNGAMVATRISGAATTTYEPTNEAAGGGCLGFVEQDALIGVPAR